MDDPKGLKTNLRPARKKSKRIKNKNCEESLLQLSERHSGLYFKIIKKYSKSFFANNINIDEASSDKNLIIWNSAKNFKEDKNVKFSTWLANQVKYFCLNTLNKKSKEFWKNPLRMDCETRRK